MLGLLLVDHGSRRPQANLQLEEMAAHLRALRPAALVGVAHLEICPPSIPQGITLLVARGATQVQVLEYFLSDGRHSQEDIPAACAAAQAEHPGVRISAGRVLGPHRLLAELLLERAGILPDGG